MSGTVKVDVAGMCLLLFGSCYQSKLWVVREWMRHASVLSPQLAGLSGRWVVCARLPFVRLCVLSICLSCVRCADRCRSVHVTLYSEDTLRITQCTKRSTRRIMRWHIVGQSVQLRLFTASECGKVESHRSHHRLLLLLSCAIKLSWSHVSTRFLCCNFASTTARCLIR